MARRVSTALLFSLTAFAAAFPAAATSYQMMSDRDLTDQAAAVAAVRVIGVEQAPASRQVATDYIVEVDSVLRAACRAARWSSASSAAWAATASA